MADSLFNYLSGWRWIAPAPDPAEAAGALALRAPPATGTGEATQPATDAIANRVGRRAYALWLASGRPEGSALLFWLRAERQLGLVEAIPPDDPFLLLHELGRLARGAATPPGQFLSR